MSSSANVPANAIAISALGMATPLGELVSGCAAARAGLLRISPLDGTETFEPNSVEMEPVAGHQVSGVTNGYSGLGRLARLGVPALQQLAASPGWLSGSGPTGLFLALPGDYFLSQQLRAEASEEGASWPPDAKVFAEQLEARKKLEAKLVPHLASLGGVDFDECRLFFDDQVGFVSALAEAAGALRSQRVKRCVVGGIDSLCDPELLGDLLELGMLKTPTTPARFIPGEAAALFCLELHSAIAARSGHAYATVEGPSVISDPVHRFAEEPCIGRSAAAAIQACLDLLADGGRETGLIIGDLNGDEWRSRDWGNALLQIPRELADLPQWNTGIHFGEIGAAAPATAVCLAVRGFERGYAGTRNVLIWTSAYAGAKGAFYLRAAN